MQKFLMIDCQEVREYMHTFQQVEKSHVQYILFHYQMKKEPVQKEINQASDYNSVKLLFP